jgi:hypothetical protein
VRNLTTDDAVTGVSVVGSTVTLSLADPLDPSDSVTLEYLGSAVKDVAGNLAAAFAPTSVSLGGGSGSGSGGSGSGSDGSISQVLPPPPPPPPPATFVSVTPADGSVLQDLTQLSFRASITVHWINITVTPDGGAAIPLADGWGNPYDVAFTPPAQGPYTIDADMVDGRYGDFVPVHVTSRFYFGTPPPPPPPPPPPASNQATPGSSGTLATADGGATVTWNGGTFADSVLVDVTAVTDGVAASGGGRAVQVTAHRVGDNAPVHELAGTLDIHFPNAPADAIPAVSEDNVVWSPLPLLPSHDLPSGVAAGYSRDADGTVHIETTHLTYFGLLRAAASKLALRVAGTSRLVAGKQHTVAARLQTTRAATVTATLWSPRGVKLHGWTLHVRAGTSIVHLSWPATALAAGVYTVRYEARSGGQTTSGVMRVQVVRSAGRAKLPIEVVLSGHKQLSAPGLRVVATTADGAFDRAGDLRANVSVIVYDVDQNGLKTLRDLHAVFPAIRIVALSTDPLTLARAMKSGATVAVPTGTPNAALSALVGRLALLAN